jgi:predicted alpha/beta hydrolase family esterase
VRMQNSERDYGSRLRRSRLAGTFPAAALPLSRGMALEDWARLPDGKIEVYPLVAYQTLVAHGVMCALKVHYLEDPQQMLAGENSSLPFILTPEMARQMAAALVRCADEAEQGPRDRQGL